MKELVICCKECGKKRTLKFPKSLPCKHIEALELWIYQIVEPEKKPIVFTKYETVTSQ